MKQVVIAGLMLGAVPVAGGAIVETFQVGTGLLTSTVQVDFSNGNAYSFEVSWQDAGTTGWDLMTTIADELDEVSLDFSTSQWGVFLEGIGVDDDYEYGVGAGWNEGIEDYWHYWTADSASDPWAVSGVGADSRLASDGSTDGWVFLSSDAPFTVPAPGALGLLSIAVMGRRRRR